MTGTTYSLDWPTFDALQSAAGGGSDAFVVKMAAATTDVPVTNVNARVRLRDDDLVTSLDPRKVRVVYVIPCFRAGGRRVR